METKGVQYGAYDQKSAKYERPERPFDIVEVMRAFVDMANQPFQGRREGVMAAPQRHNGIGGQETTAENPLGMAGGDPFTNGFFKSNAERAAKTAAEGQYMPGPESLAGNAHYIAATGGLGTNAERAKAATTSRWEPTKGAFNFPELVKDQYGHPIASVENQMRVNNAIAGPDSNEKMRQLPSMNGVINPRKNGTVSRPGRSFQF